MLSQDGYAVIAADGPGEYDVIGESRAGAMDDVQLTPGMVVYITTGKRLWNLHATCLWACMHRACVLHSSRTHERTHVSNCSHMPIIWSIYMCMHGISMHELFTHPRQLFCSTNAPPMQVPQCPQELMLLSRCVCMDVENGRVNLLPGLLCII